MEHTPFLHKTKNCSRPVWGYRLQAGDLLQEGDLYDSTSGDWSPCPVPGATLGEGTNAVWVRPSPLPSVARESSSIDPRFLEGRMAAYLEAAQELEDMRIVGRSVLQYLQERAEQCRVQLEQRSAG